MAQRPSRLTLAPHSSRDHFAPRMLATSSGESARANEQHLRATVVSAREPFHDSSLTPRAQRATARLEHAPPPARASDRAARGRSPARYANQTRGRRALHAAACRSRAAGARGRAPAQPVQRAVRRLTDGACSPSAPSRRREPRCPITAAVRPAGAAPRSGGPPPRPAPKPHRLEPRNDAKPCRRRSLPVGHPDVLHLGRLAQELAPLALRCGRASRAGAVGAECASCCRRSTCSTTPVTSSRAEVPDRIHVVVRGERPARARRAGR